jgi:hypothetical protein
MDGSGRTSPWWRGLKIWANSRCRIEEGEGRREHAGDDEEQAVQEHGGHRLARVDAQCSQGADAAQFGHAEFRRWGQNQPGGKPEEVRGERVPVGDLLRSEGA